MASTIITPEDLQDFKLVRLEDIQKMLETHKYNTYSLTQTSFKGND